LDRELARGDRGAVLSRAFAQQRVCLDRERVKRATRGDPCEGDRGRWCVFVRVRARACVMLGKDANGRRAEGAEEAREEEREQREPKGPL